MRVLQAWEEKYAMEMLANGSQMLGAHMEVLQDLTPDGFFTRQIIIHFPERDVPLLPPAADS